MKTGNTMKFRLTASHLAIPLGVSNGPAVGTAVGVALLAACAWRCG